MSKVTADMIASGRAGDQESAAKRRRMVNHVRDVCVSG